LRDELGRLLVSIDRTEEAEQWYERWLLEAPAADPALLGLIRLRLKEKNFAADLIRCDALLTLRPQLAEGLQLKAETLMALHREREAAAIYSELATLPAHRVDAELGLGRATRVFAGESAAGAHFAAALSVEPGRPAVRFHAVGRAAVRSEAFLRELTGGREESDRSGAAPGPSSVMERAPRLVEWAGLYADLGEFALAVRCLRAARVADPDYFPAWAQLAEFLAIDRQFDAALAEFALLRAAMPENRQVLLGEARALAWSRRYQPALTAYAALAALNPADPVPLREAARTAGWGKMRDRGAGLYRRIWTSEPVDRVLAAKLKPVLEGATGSEIVARWRQWTENPMLASEPFGWGERFAEDRFDLRSALPESRRRRIDEVYLEVLPRLRLQRAWWLSGKFCASGGGVGPAGDRAIRA
jgi:tetratricopeptide (TPR) repeat protein